MSRYLPDLERFWSRVEKTDACWIWRGYIDPVGYGRLRFAGKTQLAHRVSFVIANGSIPAGLTLDHLCYVKACVNPAHLDPVSQAVNYARAVEMGRVAGNGEEHRQKTHCAQDHPYDEENTYYRKAGAGRSCRECTRTRMVERRRAKGIQPRNFTSRGPA